MRSTFIVLLLCIQYIIYSMKYEWSMYWCAQRIDRENLPFHLRNIKLYFQKYFSTFSAPSIQCSVLSVNHFQSIVSFAGLVVIFFRLIFFPSFFFRSVLFTILYIRLWSLVFNSRVSLSIHWTYLTINFSIPSVN